MSLTTKPESLDDVLFEHRNKEYGAYQLRKQYLTSIGIALVISAIVYSIGVTSPLIKEKYFPTPVVVDTLDTMDLVLEAPPAVDDQPEPPPPPPPVLEPPKIETVRFVPPKIVAQVLDTTEFKMPVDTAAKIGKKNVDGQKDPNALLTGEGDVPVVVPPVKKDVIVENVQEYPVCTYNGGWQQYILDNFSVPKRAQDMKVTGMIYVRFLITHDGKVSNVRIIKNTLTPGDYGCSDEAMRICSKMEGLWLPGKNDGKPVSYEHTVPIRIKN